MRSFTMPVNGIETLNNYDKSFSGRYQRCPDIKAANIDRKTLFNISNIKVLNNNSYLK